MVMFSLAMMGDDGETMKYEALADREVMVGLRGRHQGGQPDGVHERPHSAPGPHQDRRGRDGGHAWSVRPARPRRPSGRSWRSRHWTAPPALMAPMAPPAQTAPMAMTVPAALPVVTAPTAPTARTAHPAPRAVPVPRVRSDLPALPVVRALRVSPAAAEHSP